MQAEKLIEVKRSVLGTLFVPAVLRGAALHLRVLLVVVWTAALQQITCDVQNLDADLEWSRRRRSHQPVDPPTTRGRPTLETEA